MNAVIRLENVTKDYQLGETIVHALTGVTMAMSRGEMTVLVGPSGSGKSTLLHILGCLDRVTSGSYWLDGVEVGNTDFDQLAETRNRKIGFIFQNFNLIPILSTIENIEFPCQLRSDALSRDELRSRAEKAARDVGLSHVLHHRPDQLSGGQRQRVAIARALVTDPVLVLADEPTANLDTATSEQILDVMQQLNVERQVTFLFSTHDPRVERRARRVLRMQDGHVVEHATQ